MCSIKHITSIIRANVIYEHNLRSLVQFQHQVKNPSNQLVESTHFHGPNMVICEVVADGKRTPLIGSYLTPSTLDHLPDLEEALARFRYQDPIVLGDLNANIGQYQKPRNQHVTDLLIEYGPVELITQFRKRLRFCHMKTWSQVRKGRLLWTGSIPRCPLPSHSLVRIENHLFIVGIVPNLNKELKFIY